MWDWSLVWKIWLCLLIAAVIGGIIGWLLRSLFCKSKFDEYEGRLRDNEEEIARLRGSLSKAKDDASVENNKDDAEIAALKAQISSLEGNLKASANLDADWKKKYAALESDLKVCHDRQFTLESDLKGWESKVATLSSAGAVAGSSVDDGEVNRLRAELDGLKVKLNETENERVYLLGQVKRAESGESIKREVPMDQRDDLELIHGVGPVLERMLYDMGIYFFKDIASWDAAKIAEMNEKLPNFRGRIEREGWVASAKEEHFKKYGEKL
jgi:predicted flap endonuclease-1-like 5' DNA nuclease